MRRRLGLTVLAVTMMVTLSFTIPFAAVIRSVAADRALIAADQESESLAGVLSADIPIDQLRTVLAQLNVDNGRQATVLLRGNQQIGARIRVPAADLVVARSGRAFTTSWNGETRVIVPVRLATGAVSVGIVGVPSGLLTHGVAFAWLVLGLVSVFIVLLGVLLADRLGRSLVASVRRLGSVTSRLRSGDLEARAVIEGPAEIREVGEAVNSLAVRIGEMLDHERETAADLSHRLRTPLMALQLEAGSLENDRDRRRLMVAIRDLTDAVTAVILSARRDVRAVVAVEDSDLTEVVSERLAFWSVLADDQGRQWSSALDPAPLMVAIDRDELIAAIDALIANVFAHTVEGVGFTVATKAIDASLVELVVADDGTGFSDNVVRERGHSGIGSTGLGLDIVTQTAKRSGGTVTLETSANGGALVRVFLGRAGVERGS